MLSRVADGLYWMARYVERAEHTARMLEVNLNLMLDEELEDGSERWKRLLRMLDISTDGPESDADASRIAQFLTLDLKSAASILSCITFARDNAKQLREHISSEMWERLNRLYLELRESKAEHLWRDEPQEFCRRVIDGVSLFTGVTLATINHGRAWHVLQTARYLERTLNVCTVLDVHYQEFFDPEHPGELGSDFMEWVGLLKACAAFEAYCRVYTADFSPAQIAEFLLLNLEFPQAVGFSVVSMHEELKGLEQTSGKAAVQLHRLTGKLQAAQRYGQIEEIMAAGLHDYLGGIKQQVNLVHHAFYQTYITYPIDSALTAS